MCAVRLNPMVNEDFQIKVQMKSTLHSTQIRKVTRLWRFRFEYTKYNVLGNTFLKACEARAFEFCQ